MLTDSPKTPSPAILSNRDITSTIPIQREFVQCCRPLMRIVYRISEQDFMEARDLFIANEKPWYRKLSRRLLPWVGRVGTPNARVLLGRNTSSGHRLLLGLCQGQRTSGNRVTRRKEYGTYF